MSNQPRSFLGATRLPARSRARLRLLLRHHSPRSDTSDVNWTTQAWGRTRRTMVLSETRSRWIGLTLFRVLRKGLWLYENLSRLRGRVNALDETHSRTRVPFRSEAGCPARRATRTRAVPRSRPL